MPFRYRNVNAAGWSSPVLRHVRRSSAVDAAADELRAAVYRGDLPPGSVLPEVRIAADLGISRSTLREALQRLVQEGVVESVPGRTAVVRRLSGPEIAEQLQLRIAVESRAHRLLGDKLAALRHGEDPEYFIGELLAPVVRAHEELRLAVVQGDPQGIGDADLAFHASIVERSGNTVLAAEFASLQLLTRMASFSQAGGYALRADAVERHGEILDALRCCDGERSAALVTRMLEAVIERFTMPADPDMDVFVGVLRPRSSAEVSWDELNHR